MDSEKLSVLIVEDDPIHSLLLKKLFLSLGYTIAGKAESGQEAINKAIKLKPDLITMDIMLSDDVDGIEAAKEILKEIDTNLVYLSANRDKNILKRASETDYKKFFSKPLNMNELRNFFGKPVVEKI